MQIGMLWKSIGGTFGISNSGKRAIGRKISKEGKTNEQLWDMQRLLLRSKPLKVGHFVGLTDFKHYIAVGVLVNWRKTASKQRLEIILAG
jgi:hypothetical protein